MATALLNPTMRHDIALLMSDATARPKLQRYISKLKREKLKADEDAKRHFADQLKADLREALQELKDEREGKTQLKDAWELLNEL